MFSLPPMEFYDFIIRYYFISKPVLQQPQESQSVPQADKKMVDTVAVPQNMQAVANGIPVYYQIPVVDGTGNVVQRLPIERSVRKSSNSGVASLFARLSFKKRSRADIVRLVATGDLVPAQLVQIKIISATGESPIAQKPFSLRSRAHSAGVYALIDTA